MERESADDEIALFLDRWLQSVVTKDIRAASSLREEGYTARLADDRILTRQQELDIIASPNMRLREPALRQIEVRRSGDEATVLFGLEIGDDEADARSLHRCQLRLSRNGGQWRARRFRLLDEAIPFEAAAGFDGTRPRSRLRTLVHLLPVSIRRWLRTQLRRGRARESSSFLGLSYVPYNKGSDYVIVPSELDGTSHETGDLPIPPRELWLGYNYPEHGHAHVSAMLEIVSASGFSFEPGGRILDLGCGAGRMIRHLRELASSCEIWGADISAEHIYWCQHNLSPPFHFLTTTRLPHLPFEDRSFRFIYCGSLFTHIDDLTDAWLLELHRLLAEDGRLYVTIHDRHTIELFDEKPHASADIVKTIKAFPLFAKTGSDFSFLSVGRDGDPQVFYDVDYFRRKVGSAFEVLSVTEEAYFYQTAILLKRKQAERRARVDCRQA